MPSVALHLHLADQLLSSTRAGREVLQAGPAAVNAFRMGALGPDIGYMPGGHRPLSDLAHCLMPADLSRTLIRSARSTVESAFAAGWMSHVLADLLIHPLVGRAVAALVGDGGERFIDGDRAPAAHVQVEAGLDAHYGRAHPELLAIQLGPVFGETSIRYLSDAYGRTYGIEVPQPLVLRSHRLSARRGIQALWLARFLAWRTGGRRPRPPGQESVLGRSVGRRCVAAAYLAPVTPGPRLTSDVEAASRSLLLRFDTEWRREGMGLRNLNLDTGRPDVLETAHGGLRRTLAYLSRSGGGPDGLLAPARSA